MSTRLSVGTNFVVTLYRTVTVLFVKKALCEDFDCKGSREKRAYESGCSRLSFELKSDKNCKKKTLKTEKLKNSNLKKDMSFNIRKS